MNVNCCKYGTRASVKTGHGRNGILKAEMCESPLSWLQLHFLDHAYEEPWLGLEQIFVMEM